MLFTQSKNLLAILGVGVFWVFVVLVHSCSLSSSSLQKKLVVGKGERKVSALMESTLKEMRSGSHDNSVNGKFGFGGGVEDVYGEDRATEDQLVTPWTVSIARCEMDHIESIVYVGTKNLFVRI